MSKERPTLEERLQSLQQGFFGRNRDLKEADPIEPTPMSVPIERIRPYDRNPRQERNEAYDRIRQSISSRGFTGLLPITRRPGEPDYMVAEGGNGAADSERTSCRDGRCQRRRENRLKVAL